MVWRRLYWDALFVGPGVAVSLLYHCWLMRLIKRQPQRTSIGVNNAGQSFWVAAMLKENDKKNVLVVQSLRNNLMGSTLIATSSFVICCALLAFTSTISDKKQLVETNLNQVEVSHKVVTLILFFMSSFICHTLSMAFLNQLSMVLNTLVIPESKVTVEQLLMMLEKGMLLSTVGTRIFFMALPLILWIFNPVLVFASSCVIVAILYSIDIIPRPKSPPDYGDAENGRAPDVAH